MTTNTRKHPEGTFAVGQLVRVTQAYRGNNHYEPDGHEGIYTIVRELNRGDWYIARGDVRGTSCTDWDLISHASRLSHDLKGSN